MTAYVEQISPDVAVLAIVGLVGIVVIAALGRRLSVTVGNVHAELTPNGGSSVRDAIDRIETQAKSAVTRAEIAATQATVAADKAADALERIERLEQATPATATAIVVTPSAEQPG